MEHYEQLPLVIFTVLSQMSVGMALLLTWGTLRGTLITTRMHWLVDRVGAGRGVHCGSLTSGASRSCV